VLYLTAPEPQVGDQPVDPVPFGVEGIEAPFVPDHQEDDKGAAQADGESEDVQEREGLFAPERADGYFEVVADHGYSYLRALTGSASAARTARYPTVPQAMRMAG